MKYQSHHDYGPTLLYVCNSQEDWHYRLFLLIYVLFMLIIWPIIIAAIFSGASVGVRVFFCLFADLFILVFVVTRFPVRYEVWSDSFRVISILPFAPLAGYRSTPLKHIEDVKVEDSASRETLVWFATGRFHPRECSAFSNVVHISIKTGVVGSKLQFLYDLLVTPDEPEELMIQLGRAIGRSEQNQTSDSAGEVHDELSAADRIPFNNQSVPDVEYSGLGRA